MARPAQPLVWHQLRFVLPLAQDAAVTLVERLLADSSLGRVVLELRASGGQAVWAVGSYAGERLVSVVRELVSGCRVSRGFSRRAVSQAVVVSARTVGMGLAAERLAAVVRAVLAALAVTAEGEELVGQLQLGRRFAPQALGRVEPQGWLELLGLVPIPSLSGERGRRMRAQVGRHRAAVCLRLGVRAASPLRQRVLLQGLLGALRLVEGPGVRLRARTEHPAKLDAVRRPWRAGLELGAAEIVGMAGWPIGELPLPLLGSGHPRQIAPPPEVASGSSQRVVGTGAVPGETGLVRLPIADAVYHTHLLGPTGVGKSTVLLSLALADAAEGRGLLLLDPKGDLATDFVARLPQERADDVVVLDPTNPCPVGFNPLAGPPELAVVTAEAVLGVLAELFRDSWGIRTADVLSAALLTLARIPQATLVWLVPLLTNPAFRRRVLALAPPDPLGTDVFWQGYEAKPVRTQAVEVAPVLNKLRQLMLRPGLRAMLGQAQPRFGLVDLLERRRIVVVNLNQGLLGAGAARLLGTLLVAQLWQHLLVRQASRLSGGRSSACISMRSRPSWPGCRAAWPGRPGPGPLARGGLSPGASVPRAAEHRDDAGGGEQHALQGVLRVVGDRCGCSGSIGPGAGGGRLPAAVPVPGLRHRHAPRTPLGLVLPGHPACPTSGARPSPALRRQPRPLRHPSRADRSRPHRPDQRRYTSHR